MTDRIERVCVVGAGLAGLACALAAARQGLQVDVVDAAVAAPSLPAHVNVVPNMLRELAALGLAEECTRRGFAYHGTDVLDRAGRTLFTLPSDRLAGARHPAALGIGLDVLRDILARAAQQAGARLHGGLRVHAVVREAGALQVQPVSGPALHADAVLLAAGARSPLRAALFPHATPPRDTGQAWWYAMVPRPLALDRPWLASARTGHKALVVPVSPDRASLVLVEPAALAPALPLASAASHLRSRLAAFAPQVRALASHLRDGEPVARRAIQTALLPEPWSVPGVLAVGACAHALPPHFGQSAAVGFEDAVVLGGLLRQRPDAATLAQAFAARRVPRVRHIHEITTRAAQWDAEPEPATDLRSLFEALQRIVVQPA